MRHYGDGFDFMVVKEGDKISLGSRELTFVPMPMLHWPDNMVTYCTQDCILFSNDAFGQHYASSKRFDDEVDEYVLFYEAKKYFANILWPYARLIGGALKKASALDIKMIAPAHGVIWRSKIAQILENMQPGERALMVKALLLPTIPCGAARKHWHEPWLKVLLLPV